ncbi:TIGR02117 family protein [Wielerella bovis]|uniref:TIGR02117 family protein n=1 Tax=Wielerella bovis TaxID=2917790 RepID=UPI002019024E|nr:TIGR02117 family protein [Wielerella bovis]MCG7656741.1 TIGR02117 family protein [Wielerella bovis]MCG7658964.1 TIGR02117 family protein [Wielerella bovis]
MSGSLKKCFAILMGIGVAILAFLAAYLFAAWSLGQWRVNREQPDASHQTIAVYIVSNGAHTDIVMPMETAQWRWRDWVSETDTKQAQFIAQWVSIGWGDKGFYLETPTWADLKASTAIKAISGFNQTALHVSFQAAEPDEQDARVAKIMLSPEQYQRLSQHISHYFVRQNGKSIAIKNVAYTDLDTFYEAHGRYHAFMTCNTWTNLQLKNSGAPALMWTPFAQSLLQALD